MMNRPMHKFTGRRYKNKNVRIKLGMPVNNRYQTPLGYKIHWALSMERSYGPGPYHWRSVK